MRSLYFLSILATYSLHSFNKTRFLLFQPHKENIRLGRDMCHGLISECSITFLVWNGRGMTIIDKYHIYEKFYCTGIYLHIRLYYKLKNFTNFPTYHWYALHAYHTHVTWTKLFPQIYFFPVNIITQHLIWTLERLVKWTT